MKILFIRSLNPYFESSASGNRYAGILDGLLHQGAEITLLVTGGYINISEYRSKGKIKNTNNLEIKYLITTFNHNIWLRRLNKYILSSIFQPFVNFRLKSYFYADYNFFWITFEKNILKIFNSNKFRLKGKSIIELNEYNDLHLGSIKMGNILQLRTAEKENANFLEALKKIDLLAIMTKTLMQHYRCMGKADAKFFHLPMTVDLARFSEIHTRKITYDKPYIAYTGTFNNQKDGVDILIQAFAFLADKYPEYKLYLAGFYYYDVPMQKKMIVDHQLDERIIYLDVIDKAEIPSFIQNAELLVMARPDSRQARGGFPTKLGEYLATGKPVCVTKVGEIPDYLEDNISAFMADPGSINSFADAMDRALSDAENAKNVGINGRKVAEQQFSIDVQAERLMLFLKENL